MDPVQQLREQLNCSLAKQLDFNNCYIDNCDISSIKISWQRHLWCIVKEMVLYKW